MCVNPQHLRLDPNGEVKGTVTLLGRLNYTTMIE